MLIEFHVIQDHGPSNMNRGQDGRPKTAFYGGTQRLRVSSQCWKRALRQPRPADRRDTEPGIFEKTVGPSHFGVRTRLLPEKVAERWIQEFGPAAPFVDGIKAAVSIVAKKDGKAEDAKADRRVRTPQAIYLDLDREVDRIISVLKELHKANDLESLADESAIFADHLKTAADEIDWEGKDPAKSIAWESVKRPEAWRLFLGAFETLDLSERPEAFEPSADCETLVPTYEFAAGILTVLKAIQSRDAKQANDILKAFAPPRNKNTKSGARVSLSSLLKQTAKQPVSAADIALFGRMTTSEAFCDVEAACQVADAISTHPVDVETDYFTAVDDLDSSSGAAHVGEADFASAVFYHNLAVDYDALLRNLGADLPADKQADASLKKIAAEAKETAAKAIEGLLRAIMHNVPSGKINSHAHNQQPSLILIEVKPQKLATNYLTAFHDPARPGEREDGSVETLLTDSVRKLLAFARYRDRKLPIPGTKRLLFTFDPATEEAVLRLRESLKAGEKSPLVDDAFFQHSSLQTCETFDDLVSQLRAAIREGDPQ